MINVNKAIEIVEFCEKSNFDNFLLVIGMSDLWHILVFRNEEMVMKIAFFVKDKEEQDTIITYFKRNGFRIRKDGEDL